MATDEKRGRGPAWVLAITFAAWAAVVLYFYALQFADEFAALWRRIAS